MLASEAWEIAYKAIADTGEVAHVLDWIKAEAEAQRFETIYFLSLNDRQLKTLRYLGYDVNLDPAGDCWVIKWKYPQA